MKRMYSLVLSLGLSLGLSGCYNNSVDESVKDKIENQKKAIIKENVNSKVEIAAVENKKTSFNLEEFKKHPFIKDSRLIFGKHKSVGDGWFLVEARQSGKKINIFTNNKKMIVGRGYDLKKFEELKFQIDTEKYKKMASFKIGNGPKEYFLFTDPECPACKGFDKKLAFKAAKENLTIYAFLYPLNFHLAANAMSKAILSQPYNKRAEYASKIMHSPLYTIIKEIDKYSSDLYKDILNAYKNRNLSNLPTRYALDINRAYGVNLKTKEEIVKFANKKIIEIKGSLKIDNELRGTLRATSNDFVVSGTPMIFDMNGNKVENRGELLNGLVNKKAIDQIIRKGKTVQLGTPGKEKLYIFSSTKCPGCIQHFKNKQMMDYLKSKYELHFILMATGNRAKAINELKYLYSIDDIKERAVEFERIMLGGMLSDENSNKQYSDEFLREINTYGGLLNETNVNSTPVLVNSNGKVVNNPKEL